MFPRSKEWQAVAVVVILVLCNHYLGLELIFEKDTSGRIASFLKLVGESGWVHADQYGFILRVNEYWFGLGKLSPAILNSPILLWGGIILVVASVFQLLFDWEGRSEAIVIEAEPQPAATPSKSLKEYLNPHDPLWGMLAGSDALTLRVGDRQRTSVDVKVHLKSGGRTFDPTSWTLTISDDQTFTLASADCYVTLHEMDGQWHGWWNDGDGSMDARYSLGHLTRDGSGWRGKDVSITISHDASSTQATHVPQRRRSLLRYLAATAGIAIFIGMIIASNVLPDDSANVETSDSGAGTDESDLMANAVDEMGAVGEPMDDDYDAGEALQTNEAEAASSPLSSNIATSMDQPVTITPGRFDAAISAQIKPCYVIPTGEADAAEIITKLAIKFEPDGSVANIHVIGHEGITELNEGYVAQMDEAAIRAVTRCSPLKLPSVQYDEGWQDIEFVVDPEKF